MPKLKGTESYERLRAEREGWLKPADYRAPEFGRGAKVGTVREIPTRVLQRVAH